MVGGKGSSFNLILGGLTIMEINLCISSYLLRAKHKITKGSTCSNDRKRAIVQEQWQLETSLQLLK